MIWNGKADKSQYTGDPNELFGVLKYSSQNIGDEIQSIAAMRFLPKIDQYLHRERLDQFYLHDKTSARQQVKLIMNAWWMWNPEHFPPSEDIDPLLISMHLREQLHDKFNRPEILEYFHLYGPVGCRDMSTLNYLESLGVPAYFSGCLTTTLLPNEEFRRRKGGDYVLCVDLPEHLEEEIRSRTDRPVYNISRMLSVAFTAKDRLRLAKCVLALYHNAHCVVTSRLHVSLPSTAFGTPCCLIMLKGESRRGRFMGMEGCFNQITEEDFLADKNAYNFDNPPANPTKYQEIAGPLVEKCSKFTGYDHQDSPFEDGYEPLIELIGMLKMDNDVLRRTLVFATKEDLLKTLYEKQVNKFNKHDLSY